MEEIERLERFLNYIFANTVVLANGDVVERRELVDRINGLKIEIYPNEHPPPHFHIKGPGINVSFNILTCEILKGSLDRKLKKKIEYFHRLRKNKLIEVWNKLRPSDGQVGVLQI